MCVYEMGNLRIVDLSKIQRQRAEDAICSASIPAVLSRISTPTWI